MLIQLLLAVTELWSEVLVTQSCLTLSYPMNWDSPGSSIHGILQAIKLEWVAISFSRGSSWPRNRTQVFCIAGRLFTVWVIREAQLRYLPFQSPFYKGRNWSTERLCNVSKIEQLESEWARIWTKVVPIMLHYRNFPKVLGNSDFEQWSSDLHMCTMAEGRYYEFKQSFREFISRLSASQNSLS